MVKNPFWDRLEKKRTPPVLRSFFAARQNTPADLSPAEGVAEPDSSPMEGSTARAGSVPGWRWSLTWLVVLAIFCGMGTSAFIWLVMLPPPVECKQMSDQSTDMERLYCAQEAARSGELKDLVAGIETLNQWSSDHPLHGQAQDLIATWSGQLLEIARAKVKQNDLKGALAAVQKIPKTTPVYAEAQKSVAIWQKYAQQAAVMYAKAQTALKQQQWDIVAEQILALSDFEQTYWQLEKGSTALSQQLGAEKQARQTLSQARRLAANPDSLQLGVAIATASQISGGTYAAEEASPLLKQWSQKLLTLANQKWQQGNPQAAVDLLRSVPATVKLPEVQDLVRFAQAYQLAIGGATSKWMPSLEQLYRLMEAIGALKQIPSGSPFYAQAQSLQKNWQAQLQDLTQLQFAYMTAEVGQHNSLQWAIAQASQIPPKNPRRLLAQTLVSHWQKESERIEDQPILERALALAKPGDSRSLKNAIEQARRVQPRRSLRLQAQTLIASWQDQIERIEDQPLLDQAWLLAENGDLDTAITVVKKVAPGRVLYREAQSLVDRWNTELIVRAQIAADRPILDRARSLAANGDLSTAISVASQIDPGRALYGEAQSAIGGWQSERDRLWNPQPDVSDDYSEPLPDDSEYSPAPDSQWSPSPEPFSNSTDPATGGLPSAIETVPAPESSPVVVETEPGPPPPPEAIEPAPAPQAEPSSEEPPFDGYYDNRYNN
ncbi:hypothetical protein [Leptolyngbya sp. FACHB-711]|uniref:hypothetical protein n=1 Tax=Leptolyngbya sp. FACHB-711 TaxID=2692813 RepID=UPI001683FBF5|nr:hypothetical protein [Leptolyngbya sp. FACHB-711]MBD1853884.1 hypothetical protein [Cyanobacteria bacterium FACHB-502]MBD2024319.1 hypothetical protein [Leptolyngbya sp. FACHB-711]